MDQFKSAVYDGPHGVKVRDSKLTLYNYYGPGESVVVPVSLKMTETLFNARTVREFLKYCVTKKNPRGSWCATVANDFKDMSSKEIIGYLIAVTGVAYTLVRDDVPKPSEKEVRKLVQYDQICSRVGVLLDQMTGDGRDFIVWFLNGLKKFRFLTVPVENDELPKPRRETSDVSISFLWLLLILVILFVIYYLATRVPVSGVVKA